MPQAIAPLGVQLADKQLSIRLTIEPAGARLLLLEEQPLAEWHLSIEILPKAGQLAVIVAHHTC